MVLPDNSASIPAYTVVDAALRYETKIANARWAWRAGIDNLFDKRAWRESPYQFSHAYLYPLAPRTFRLSVQVDI
jgi:iron complex outermembrane receptor protein